MKRVFINLIQNAVDAMPTGGTQGTISNVPEVTLIAVIITAIAISALAAIILHRKRSSIH